MTDENIELLTMKDKAKKSIVPSVLNHDPKYPSISKYSRDMIRQQLLSDNIKQGRWKLNKKSIPDV